jgi:small-conductance mechanosensitive channel
MRSFLSGMAVLAATLASVPAAAQYNNSANQSANRPDGGDIAGRIQRMEARLQTAVQNGDVSGEEARPLRQQLRSLAQLERRYSRNGLSQTERSDLQQRIRDLRQQFRAVDAGGQRRYAAPGSRGRDDGYNQAPGYGDRANRNDGRDDRDRDGRWDDDVRNGAEQEPAQRSGLGGIFDSIFGRDN